MKKTFAVILSLLLALALAACQNPLKKYVATDDPAEETGKSSPTDGASTEKPQQEATSDEGTKEKEDAADDALRTELLGKIKTRIGEKDPGTGDVYRFELGERIQDSTGKEYFYGRWMRVIHDLDSGKDVPSLVAELFATPDGKELYVGSYSSDSSGSGKAVMLATGNLFDPTVDFNP